MTPKSAYEATGDDAPASCGDAETVGDRVRSAGAAVGDATGTVAGARFVAGTWVGVKAGIAEAVTGTTVTASVGVAAGAGGVGVRTPVGARVTCTLVGASAEEALAHT